MTVFSQSLGSARVVLIQATVLVVVFLALAITPAPVTFPTGTWEVVLLLKGAAALLLTDVILRGAWRDTHTPSFGDVTARLVRAASSAHPLDHYHVQDANGTIGIVEEVLVDRQHISRAIVVAHGWARGHRFVVDIDDVRAVDHDARTVTVTTTCGS
jgi:hypothetical protein